MHSHSSHAIEHTPRHRANGKPAWHAVTRRSGVVDEHVAHRDWSENQRPRIARDSFTNAPQCSATPRAHTRTPPLVSAVQSAAVASCTCRAIMGACCSAPADGESTTATKGVVNVIQGSMPLIKTSESSLQLSVDVEASTSFVSAL